MTTVPSGVAFGVSDWGPQEPGGESGIRIHLKTSIQGLTEHGGHSKDLEIPRSSG